MPYSVDTKCVSNSVFCIPCWCWGTALNYRDLRFWRHWWWKFLPYGILLPFRHFEGAQCRHLQGQAVWQSAWCSWLTFVTCCQSTRHTIPEHITLNLIYFDIFFFKAFLVVLSKFRKTSISFVMSVRLSVRMEQLDSNWANFHEIWHLRGFVKHAEKIQVSLQLDTNEECITGRLKSTFITSRSYLLRKRNVWDKRCRENQNTRFAFSNFFFFRQSRRLWDNVEKYCRAGRPQMAIWRMRIACWIPKATTQVVQYSLLFHCNNGCTNAPPCYIIRTLTVFLFFKLFSAEADSHTYFFFYGADPTQIFTGCQLFEAAFCPRIQAHDWWPI